MESELQIDRVNLDECTSAICLYHYDVVRSKHCGKIGRVTDVADEFYWFDDGFLSPEEVEVLWDGDLESECVNSTDVTLVSRGLLYSGTFVASVLDPSGQCGVVINDNTSVDLLTPDGSIIEGVDTRELIRVTDMCFDRFVLLGPWIGIVVDITNNVTVLFDNGSVSEFIEANEMSLKQVDNVNKIDGNLPNYPGYYPGQRVKGLFRSLWKPESLEGTVTKVSVELVCVEWIRYAGRDVDGFIKKPDEKQSPEKLKLLPYFEHSLWGLFGGCHLKNVEGVLKIVNLQKKVDVAWHDGTTEMGLDSSTLIRKDEITPQFFPHQFVRMKTTQENNDDCEIGFVTSVNLKEKTVLVEWQRRGIDEGEMEVSMYELEIHPQRKYFYGDIVGHYPSGDVIDQHPRIGVVIGMEKDQINVSWINGTDSKGVPEDIFDSESIEEEDEDDDDDDDGDGEDLLDVFTDLLRLISKIYLCGVKHLNPFRLKPTGKQNEGRCQRILCHSFTKDFDVIEVPSDHYFVRTEEQSKARKKWLKKVQEDWGLLQNDLPEGISVRVYEDRMDLLRAMIVGPYGTPYQDGLFFFDFHLTPEYPDVPPVVHYHSGGWKINPNLREDGKICLSLLNTWHGKGNEVWDSSFSSILQILVSIQGLVLNSKPYFNEAGYDNLIGSSEGENDALSYNESAYLLNCKRMIHLMHHPIKGFEELAREHFISRGYYILKACDAYMKGYEIGCLAKDALPNKNSKTNAISLGLKLTLATKIVPKLFLILDEVGADCHDFRYLIRT